MGFALWIDGDVAWAEGTHEYRPMGVAVVAATSQFIARDFRSRGSRRRRSDPGFAGFFGSLVEVNAHLARRRNGRETRNPAAGHVLPYF
jgi:hypothetical protein